MKKWKLPWFGLFIALCILLNYGGRMLAARLGVFLWLDSLGTVLCAYAAGPVCGSIVGITANLIYGMGNGISYIYGLTSLALGVIVGVAARRGKLESLFDTLTVSTLAAIAATVISVPLNIFFHEGWTGNPWGDGVISKLSELGWPRVISQFAGEFYIDFVDKMLSLILLFLLTRLGRLITRSGKRNAGRALAVLLAAALGLCALPLPTRAEESASDYNNYVHTLYSSTNGLPCGEANDIAQTTDGILWIGTYAGLYRYNGREFRWMNDYESVRNVNCLYVDAEGRLWIGTNDNGLSISINEEISTVLDQSMGLPSNSVRAIIQSADGDYYIGTTSSMQILTLNSGLKKMNTLWEVNYADDIAADASGRVATVTSDGRLFLLRSRKIQSSRQVTSENEIFRACCFDPQGHLLGGTSLGNIYVFDISGDTFEELGQIACPGLSSIKDLTYLENGDLIISADNGVGYLDPAGGYHAINTNDFNNSIDNMLMDYQGNLWFTSSRLGLLRMAPSAFRDVYSTVGLPSRVVNTVVKWQDVYCIGTDKGLDMVDATCQHRIVNDLTRQLEGVRIRCMLVDSAGSLWICTYGNGLIEVEKDGAQHLYSSANGSFGSRARLVIQLTDGTILAAGDTGISFIRDHRIQRTIRYSNGLINSMILTATELPDGSILAGTDGNGIALIQNGQVTRMLTREDGLSSEVILRTVADTRTGGVFIVTSNGLCYMEADGAIRRLDNFPYFNNYDIWIMEQETLFVMSSAGIYVVDREELLSGKTDLTYELLDSRRGLNSALTANAWTYYNESGELFLPCDTGVFIINTAKYTSDNPVYRMMVSSLRLDGEPIRIERSTPIVIDRSVAKIEMRPEIINYTIQDPQVGYWLEGFENSWNIQPLSSLGTIVYTNLPNGEYTFHLAVFNNDATAIVGERTYTLIKEKALYDQRGFMVYLLGVPMLAIAWLTFYFVSRQVRRVQRELAVARHQVQMGNDTVMAIAKAVDAKDERTSRHSQRVSQYSVMIAQALGMSEKECEDLRKTALMHDIGKIGIPDNILNKPSRLTDEEYALMKSHTTRGAEILKGLTLIDHVVEGAAYHHERYDGKGYPSGLKGDQIPLNARIIGVADAFDAMTANRVYRRQMDFGYVLNEMRNGSGTQFDPQMVDILLGLIEDGKINMEELYPPIPDPAEDNGQTGGGA